jgi:hypothetical protein
MTPFPQSSAVISYSQKTVCPLVRDETLKCFERDATVFISDYDRSYYADSNERCGKAMILFKRRHQRHQSDQTAGLPCGSWTVALHQGITPFVSGQLCAAKRCLVPECIIMMVTRGPAVYGVTEPPSCSQRLRIHFCA